MEVPWHTSFGLSTPPSSSHFIPAGAVVSMLGSLIPSFDKTPDHAGYSWNLNPILDAMTINGPKSD